MRFPKNDKRRFVKSFLLLIFFSNLYWNSNTESNIKTVILDSTRNKRKQIEQTSKTKLLERSKKRNSRNRFFIHSLFKYPLLKFNVILE